MVNRIPTIQVRVKLLAVFRRYLPAGSQGATCTLDIPLGTQAIEVLRQLGVPVDDPETVAMLVNGRAVPAHHVLLEGDVLAAFPPMAGG